MRKLFLGVLGLLAAVTGLSFTAPAEAGIIFNRGGGSCCGGGGGGFHLFHHRSTGCSGGYGGCTGGSGGCTGFTAGGGCTGMASAACGCSNLQAVPCADCPNGVRYVSSGTYSDGTIAYNVGNVTNTRQFAVPDGKGGYKIVTSTGGLWNGLPILDPNAPATTEPPALTNQVPVPKAMPNRQ